MCNKDGMEMLEHHGALKVLRASVHTTCFIFLLFAALRPPPPTPLSPAVYGETVAERLRSCLNIQLYCYTAEGWRNLVHKI
jgi:hypothetical protein